MFCMKCGKELPDDARFCLSCGAELPGQEKTEEKQPEEASVAQTQPAEVREEPKAEASRSAPRKKTVIIIAAALVALVVCAAVCLGIVMKPAQGQMGELHDLSAYTGEVSFQYLVGGKAVCYMESDYDNREIFSIRSVIREAEIQQVKGKKAQDLIQRVSSSERIRITLSTSSFTEFHLTVSSEGEIIVYGKDKEFGEGICYQGGQEIFDTVRAYIPAGTTIELADIFPEGDTGCVFVTYQGKNVEMEGAYLNDEEIVAACIEAIRPKSLKLSQADNMSYDGEIMSIQFSTSGAGLVTIWIDSRGNGRLTMDDWIYYLSDADSIVGPMERAIREYS